MFVPSANVEYCAAAKDARSGSGGYFRCSASSPGDAACAVRALRCLIVDRSGSTWTGSRVPGSASAGRSDVATDGLSVLY